MFNFVKEEFKMNRLQYKLSHLICNHPYVVVILALAAVLLSSEPTLAQDGLFGMRTVEAPEFDQGLISCAVGSIYELIEGSFGALIMVVAGLGAIIAAAMGAYRAMVGMLVVAVGSFILRALVSLFFASHEFIPCG